jgi:AcrR family transcriptional regulator
VPPAEERITERNRTKARILDAAENLFGSGGFEATSLRDITAEAGVNLAAVNYYFRTKDSLIDAVIERRIDPVNRQRLKMLEDVGPKPTVEQIIEAYIAPVMEMEPFRCSGLLGRVLSASNRFIARFFEKHIAMVAQKFDEALADALPHLSQGERRFRFHFTSGIIVYTLCWFDLLPKVTGGICDTTDRRALTARVVSFVSAGFRAPEAQRYLFLSGVSADAPQRSSDWRM